MSKTKGLSLKQIEKALKKGKEIEIYHFHDWALASENLNTIQKCLNAGKQYRIKPKKKKLREVVLYIDLDEDNYCNVYDSKVEETDYKITFNIDENNKPILDSVKLREVKP